VLFQRVDLSLNSPEQDDICISSILFHHLNMNTAEMCSFVLEKGGVVSLFLEMSLKKQLSQVDCKRKLSVLLGNNGVSIDKKRLLCKYCGS